MSCAQEMYPYEPRIRWETAQINELLLWATGGGMSDIQLCSSQPVWVRKDGIWQRVTTRPITTDELLAGLERITRNNSIAALIKSGQDVYDFAHQIEETRGVRRRYRGNAGAVADGYSTGVKIVFRTIPSTPPRLEALDVEQGILDHATPENGLVLVTGVMGSGKSTLLAAILRHVIETGGRNVATYESPIEFDLTSIPDPGGPVSQSSVPEHLQSFLRAVRNSTRTAPDVVLIGESRDPETMRGMVETAEIGVAAYSTVHTRSVPETISRIVNIFPVAERLQMTATLVSSLRMIISQRLLPLPSGSGRTALREYLVFTPEIREALLETAPERLIQRTEELLKAHGQTMQAAAERAYGEGLIVREKYKAILAERKRKGGIGMIQEQEKPKTPHYEVFSISEYVRDGEHKSVWLRVGAAFINKDGSFNLRLRAMPLTDPKTGTANLHMRLRVPRQNGEMQPDTEEDADSFYLHIDPLTGAPLEAL